MNKLVQDDFNADYTSTKTYPKVVYWTLNAPIIYNGIMITANVLQRKMDYDWDWEFIPSVKLASSELGEAGSTYLVQLDSTDAEITLEEQWSFDEAIDAIYRELDNLFAKYDSVQRRDYGEDAEWQGWQDFGDQLSY